MDDLVKDGDLSETAAKKIKKLLNKIPFTPGYLDKIEKILNHGTGTTLEKKMELIKILRKKYMFSRIKNSPRFRANDDINEIITQITGEQKMKPGIIKNISSIVTDQFYLTDEKLEKVREILKTNNVKHQERIIIEIKDNLKKIKKKMSYRSDRVPVLFIAVISLIVPFFLIKGLYPYISEYFMIFLGVACTLVLTKLSYQYFTKTILKL